MADEVLKVVIGKEVGGWLEPGRRGVPGSVLPNTLKAGDGFGGPLRALPNVLLFLK